MLGKLFKYDFEAAGRTFLVLYGIVACLTAIGKTVYVLLPEKPWKEPILSVLAPTYILLIAGLVIGFEIFLIVRFYRSLFTDEGYLYHTLPVKPWQLILSKLFVNVLLSLSGLVVIVLCALIMLAGSPMETLLSLKDEIAGSLQEGFGTLLSEFIPFMLLYLPIAQCSSYLTYFAAIALGQVLLPKHRVLGAFVAYMIYYVIIQVVTAIPLVVFALKSVDELMEEADILNWLVGFYHFTYFFSLGMSLVCGVAFFFITNYVMKKKLNLN